MTPRELLAQYDALKARSYDLVDPQKVQTGALEDVVRALVEAQPEVANTGSGAAPVAPADSRASNSASLTPEAAGTAPVQAQVQQ